MEYDEDINKLEHNVEKMLTSLGTVQDEKLKLQADISRLEDEKKMLEEQINQLNEEKMHVRHRVSGLLTSIEKWEKSAGGTVATVSPVTASDKTVFEPVQGVLIGN